MTDQNESTEEKTFTQEDLDRIVSERISRERAKFADYAELKDKADSADELAAQVEELTGKLTEAEGKVEESDKRASEAELTSVRLKIANEHGVPLSTLTASDEEALVEQAKSLVEWKGETKGVTREGQSSGNSSGPPMDAKARAAQALANLS